MDIEEILGKAKLPESSVPLCLAGDLQGRWEELAHQLETASTKALSLGEPAEAKTIAAQMEELREQMTGSEVTFRLRALTAKHWRPLYSAMPTEGDTPELKESFDERFHAWVCRLVAAVYIDPVMTPEKANQLSEEISSGQWKELTDAAWNINTERRNVPFSSAASAWTQSSERNSKRQEPGESPTADGSAGKSGKRPSTSMTTKAA